MNHWSIQVYPLADSIWSFDPKEGFSIDEISMDTAGSYSCSASTVEDVLQTTTIDFYVIVQRNCSVIFIFALFVFYLRTSVNFHESSKKIRITWLIDGHKVT